MFYLNVADEIGDKIIEILSSNWVTLANEKIPPRPPPPPPSPSKLGCFCCFYRWLEQQHNIAWMGWGRKILLPIVASPWSTVDGCRESNVNLCGLSLNSATWLSLR